MGVNLLPFIDIPRLLAAMKKADNNGANLTEAEKERNKRTGDISLFVQSGEESVRSKLANIPSTKIEENDQE